MPHSPCPESGQPNVEVHKMTNTTNQTSSPCSTTTKPRPVSFDFYYDIFEDSSLSLWEKHLLNHVLLLCIRDGHCWATNAGLARLLQTSPRMIKHYISGLIRKGYLRAEGGTRKRHLFPGERVSENIKRSLRDRHEQLTK